MSAEPIAWHSRRFLGGARRELTARVMFSAPGFEAQGWTLNASRGGLRVVVEDTLVAGREYEVSVGGHASRRVRAVWVHDEDDGQIVGLEYVDRARQLEAPPPPSVRS